MKMKGIGSLGERSTEGEIEALMLLKNPLLSGRDPGRQSG
jgi:hypothetical protein